MRAPHPARLGGLLGLLLAALLPVAQAQIPRSLPRPQTPRLPPQIDPERLRALAELDLQTQPYWQFDITGQGTRVRVEATRVRGRIQVQDPRTLGAPRRVSMDRGTSMNWADLYYVDAAHEALLKPVLDRRGEVVAVLGAHTGGVYLAYDPDHDGLVDALVTQPVVGDRLSDRRTVLATDDGLAALREIAEGAGLACAQPMGDLAGLAGSPGAFGPAVASFDLCGRSSSQTGRSGAGGRRPRNPSREMTTRVWDRLCATYGQGSGAQGGGLVAGGGGRDPRQFHWSDAFAALLEANSPFPSSAEDEVTDAATGAVIEAVENFAGATFGWAVGVTKNIKTFLEGGQGEWVNEADKDLWAIEQWNDSHDADMSPNRETLNEACSAGSTSSFCSDACASGSHSWCTSGGETPTPDAPEPTPEAGTAGDPIENNPTDISRTCQARREAEWRRRSYTQDTRYVRQQCGDPREHSAPSTMSSGGVELSTFCGGQPEPTAPDLGAVIGARQCPPGAQPGPDGSCGGTGAVSTRPRQSLPYGYLDTVGLEIRLRPCPDATCNPARR